jgi:hypothetical protein
MYDSETFDMKKFNDIQYKEKYQMKISNRFAALENLDESLGINSECLGKVLDTTSRPQPKKI